MEKFKIDNYYNDNPDGRFPKFRELTRQQCDDIRKLLISALDIADGNDLSLVTRIYNMQKPMGHLSENNIKNDFRNIVCRALTKPEGLVYVNWYRYDKIDEISYENLCNFFGDIWYPSADDVDIFDSSFSWILSISHYGEVRFARIRT